MEDCILLSKKYWSSKSYKGKVLRGTSATAGLARDRPGLVAVRSTCLFYDKNKIAAGGIVAELTEPRLDLQPFYVRV